MTNAKEGEVFIGNATEIAKRFIGSGDNMELRRQRCTDAIESHTAAALESQRTELLREVREAVLAVGLYSDDIDQHGRLIPFTAQSVLQQALAAIDRVAGRGE